MADSGLARSIGVSNFSLAQMRKMLAIARIPPAVLQVNSPAKTPNSDLGPLGTNLTL